MNETDSLPTLARHCGIADAYYDIWGQHHPTTDATRHALLLAMHLPLAERAAGDILQELEDAAWQRPLPPVRVLRCGEPIRVALSLPVGLATQPWHWHLQLEGGAIHSSGTLVPVQSPPAGQRRLAAAPFWRRGEAGDFCRHLLAWPALETPGYHRLTVKAPGGEEASLSLIVAPAACYQPEAVQGEGRVWGPAVQLYGLRSRRNWGIGDFTDLRALVDLTADAGGGIVGVSPLHALFPDKPAHINPYNPASRCALNILYIDIEAMPELRECTAAQTLLASPAFQARLRSLRAEGLVDPVAVAAAKHEVLALLWRHFRERHLLPNSERAQALRRYRKQAGEPLERLARFEALQAHFRAQDADTWGWPAWPEAYRDPAGAAVADFAATHANEVAYHAWLQWTADSQLGEAGRRSWQRGLGVGLYVDLAVGINPAGADAWGWQGVFAHAAYAGAPPDEFNLHGQAWGLPPFVPHRLHEAAYVPFIDMLRATMRHAGALRIDHAMSLSRIFWVPAGSVASAGAYVAYPLEDLLGIVALESHRNQCLIIGEDLGTVPEGFRPRLESAGVYAYRPLLFERSADGDFKPPAAYPRQALACASTHDLPTLCGWWQGADIEVRRALQLFPSAALHARTVAERAQDRARLLAALAREGLLPEGTAIHPAAVPALTPPLITAIHAYLARTPSRVLTVQPEDMLGSLTQANLPGSPDERHPNWRRRLSLDLEDWRDDARFRALVQAIRRERDGTPTPPSEDARPPA